MIFESVRSELLSEALNSPNLLFELANLEKYIAETYSSRVFVELLQNADDAQAKKFLVQISGDCIICANDGDVFSHSNFYSLCRNASSDKSRGSSIGYRGIGFKSVAEIATEAHLISGGIKATFSKTLTAKILNASSNVPLIRIPHSLTIHSDSNLQNQINNILQQGYSTIFIFTDINKDKINDEFHLFDSGFLLFLRNIEHVSLEYGQIHKKYECNRVSGINNEYIHQIKSSANIENWQIYNGSNCSLAVSLINDKMVGLKPDDALVHAFLPTLEQTGMSLRVNADFSTDPSRTRIVLDEQTYSSIYALCDLLKLICKIKLKENQFQNFLEVITPNIEILTIKMQKKSFRTEFILELQKQLSFLSEHLLIAPTWLNGNDIDLIFNKSKEIIHTNNNMVINFLRFINVKSIHLNDIINYINTKNHLSRLGNTQLISYILKNISSIKDKYDIKKFSLFEDNKGNIVNSHSLASNINELSEAFLAELENQINLNELNSIFFDNNTKLREQIQKNNQATCNITQISVKAQTKDYDDNKDKIIKQNTDNYVIDPIIKNAMSNSREQEIKSGNLLSEWRTAELYLFDILLNQGYRVEDRSRQNLGYDLFAVKDNIEYFFEVKLLDAIGKPFIITSNEEAVARANPDKYIIALIIKKPNEVMISFIHDPVKNLSFIRQCRQWVWECSEYSFNPITFNL